MPRALITGSFEQADPGCATVLHAVRRALPEWSTTVGERRRPGRLREAVSSPRTQRRFDATVVTGSLFGPAGTPAIPPAAGPFGAGAAMARLAVGGPTALVGVSAASVRGGARRALARALARRSELLVLRDSESARALAEAGVSPPFRIGADSAWAAMDAPDGSGRGDRIVVVLCRTALGSGSRLIAALAPLRRAGLEVELLPWGEAPRPGRRAGLVESLAAGLGPSCRLLEPPRDLAAASQRLAGAGVVVGFRHHALVAATAAGVPLVAVGDEPGLGALARGLGQAAVGRQAPPEELSAAVLTGLDREPASANAVRERIDSAVEGLRLLRLVLSDGRGVDPREIEGLRLEPVPGL